MSKPTLVFIPGLWEGPTAFSQVIPLPSTGTNAPDAATFSSDVNAIRAAVANLANKGREIIFVMHSAGAYTGSQALQNPSLAQRKQRGEAGGVKKLVYLSGALIPAGSGHPPQPLLFQTNGDRRYCRDAVSSLFNDLPIAEAEERVKELCWQPATYVESIHITYCAWKEIPSVYLCCTQDRIIPLEIQCQIAAMAGAETESYDAGHIAMVSRPERVVEVVRKAAGEVEMGESVKEDGVLLGKEGGGILG